MYTEDKNLYYLHELPDYRVAEEYPDIRGWKVLNQDYCVIGQVDGLLVNKEAERVVFLDVEVDDAIVSSGYDAFKFPAGAGMHGSLSSDAKDHLIIPVKIIQLDEEEKKVILQE